jgi:2OG-Fe(II) oxygenase superfamily
MSNYTGDIIWLKDDVASFPGLLTEEYCNKVIEYFESAGEHWMQTCFYDSLGMALVSDDDIFASSGLNDSFFEDLRLLVKSAIETAFGREVKTNSMHAQKWPLGSFARWHSDNSDLEGNLTAWRDNKYASILYLNDDYEGGELEFRDHDLSVKTVRGTLVTFPGGANNIHRVNEVLKGTRYTIVGFWDFADSVYSPEEMAEREAEIARERVRQAEQKLEWAAGNKEA